jgi:hypothetical protein
MMKVCDEIRNENEEYNLPKISTGMYFSAFALDVVTLSAFGSLIGFPIYLAISQR